jgi:hypothetical protein
MIYRSEVRSVLSLLAAFQLALGSAACGPYSFSGSALPSHIKTVVVPIFEDRTAEFGIKEMLTDAIIERITQDNTLKIADRRNADSMLDGAVLRVEDRAGAYERSERVQETKVFVTARIRFEDLRKNKVMWEDEIEQWGTYDPAGGEAARRAAIEEALRKIADEVLNRTVSSW